MLCDVAGAILIMDETTRDDFASGFPGVELPASHMFVVPKETGHWERTAIDSAVPLKRDLLRQSEILTPAQAHAFRKCTLKLMVLDERRHALDRMLDQREYELLRLFKFDLDKGPRIATGLRPNRQCSCFGRRVGVLEAVAEGCHGGCCESDV